MTALGSKRNRRSTQPSGGGFGRDLQAEGELIRRLWAEQRALPSAALLHDMEEGYLDAHFSMPLTLRRRLAMIDWLARRIQPGDRILEWGCRHAVDSCVYRHRFGSSLELYGCDYVDPETFRPFHGYCGLRYETIQHPYTLSYEDGLFDVVTSNGVWEHVSHENESLREVFRVLRPGGLFLVACLPNCYSYTEALQRRLEHVAHDRLYSVRSATALLQGAGFEVLEHARRLIVPTMLNGFPQRVKTLYNRMHGSVWALNAVLERAWPISLVASNLMFVARKPERG